MAPVPTLNKLVGKGIIGSPDTTNQTIVYDSSTDSFKFVLITPFDGKHTTLTDKEVAGVIDHADDSVTESKIKGLSISNGKLQDDSVTSGKIINDAITTDKIVNSAITTPKIITNAVTTDKIINSAVTTPKIIDEAITLAKMQNVLGNADLFIGYDASGNIVAKAAGGGGLVDSVSEELVAYANYIDETITELVDTSGGFNKLILMLQKSDSVNAAIVSAGDPNEWTQDDGPSAAVDSNFSTNAGATTGSVTKTLIIDFGAIAVRTTNIDWAGSLVSSSIVLSTSNSEGSGYTNKITHNSTFGRLTEQVASHSFRYAKVVLTYGGGTVPTGDIWQIWDAATAMGGTTTLDLEYKNEQEDVWIPLIDDLETAYDGSASVNHIIGNNNVSVIVAANTTFHGEGISIPQTATLLRIKMIVTDGLKTGLQVLKSG